MSVSFVIVTHFEIKLVHQLKPSNCLAGSSVQCTVQTRLCLEIKLRRDPYRINNKPHQNKNYISTPFSYFLQFFLFMLF